MSNKVFVRTPKIKMPGLPKLINPGRAYGGLLSGIHSGTTDRNALVSNLFYFGTKKKQEKKPVIGAGRGGKVYGQRFSNMGIIGEGAAKRTRARKKEITPYKPTPQMHTLYGLEDMRKGGI
jgi:hypothetical protein